MTRPDVPQPARQGFRWEATRDGDWSVARMTRGGCRRPHCEGAPVAWLDRGLSGQRNWYGYCADHLYGRWIESGAVMMWRLIRIPAPDRMDEARRVLARVELELDGELIVSHGDHSTCDVDDCLLLDVRAVIARLDHGER